MCVHRNPDPWPSAKQKSDGVNPVRPRDRRSGAIWWLPFLAKPPFLTRTPHNSSKQTSDSHALVRATPAKTQLPKALQPACTARLHVQDWTLCKGLHRVTVDELHGAAMHLGHSNAHNRRRSPLDCPRYIPGRPDRPRQQRSLEAQQLVAAACKRTRHSREAEGTETNMRDSPPRNTSPTAPSNGSEHSKFSGPRTEQQPPSASTTRGS